MYSFRYRQTAMSKYQFIVELRLFVYCEMITENQLVSACIILYYIFKTVISFSRHRQKIPTIQIRSQTLGFGASLIDTVLEVIVSWTSV